MKGVPNTAKFVVLKVVASASTIIGEKIEFLTFGNTNRINESAITILVLNQPHSADMLIPLNNGKISYVGGGGFFSVNITIGGWM